MSTIRMVLLKLRSSGEIIIAASKDILHQSMGVENSVEEVERTLEKWQDEGTVVKVKWPTASALSKNPFRLSEKDFRIYSATVLGFSDDMQALEQLKVLIEKSSASGPTLSPPPATVPSSPPPSTEEPLANNDSKSKSGQLAVAKKSAPPPLEDDAANENGKPKTTRSRTRNATALVPVKGPPAKKTRRNLNAEEIANKVVLSQSSGDEVDELEDSEEEVGECELDGVDVRGPGTSLRSRNATYRSFSPDMFETKLDDESDEEPPTFTVMENASADQSINGSVSADQSINGSASAAQSINGSASADQSINGAASLELIDELRSILKARDSEIASLKEELSAARERLANHPGIILEDLKLALQTAQSLVPSGGSYSAPPTPGSTCSSSSRSNIGTPSPPADSVATVKMVPLYRGCHLKLDPDNLKLAISYGMADKRDKGKRAMINRILESIYSEAYMASHSFSGRPAPGMPPESAKPAIPDKDKVALQVFVKAKWKEWHNLDCEDSSVDRAIQDKLGGSHRKSTGIKKKFEKAKDALRPNE